MDRKNVPLVSRTISTFLVFILFLLTVDQSTSAITKNTSGVDYGTKLASKSPTVATFKLPLDQSKPTSPTPTNSTSTSTSTSSTSLSTRVKRGYHGQGRSYSTGIAYNRLNDAGQQRSVGERGHGHKQGRRSPVGEDGTHTRDFKSYGVGYEHKHSGQCEESKCGYNIRHCPHGCVFNSFVCGGGAAYDTCCC